MSEAITARQRMPAEIAKSIVSVMKQVKQLGVDENNKFGGYKYVSVDKFFDHIGRLMAEAEIFVLLHETSSSVDQKATTDDRGNSKTSNWLTCRYDVFIFHSSGVEYGPIPRTIQVSATGPQAYGSAMSYAEKYFLRSLFKVPTGEEDADAHPQEGLPKNNEKVWSGKAGANARDEELQASRYYVTSSKIKIAKIASIPELREWWNKEKPIMADMFSGKEDPLYIDLKTAYAAHGESLKLSELNKVPTTAEQIGDNIPY